MKYAALLILAALSAACTSPAPNRGDEPNYQRASLILGQRGYGVAGTDMENVIGAEYVFRESESEFGGELGILYSNHTHEDMTLGGLGTFDLALTGLEAYAGARWTPNLDLGAGVQPYISGGATALRIWAAGPGADDSGTGFGWYGRVGLALPVGENTIVDLSYRRTFGVDIAFDGVGMDVDMDAGQLLLTVGVSF